ncbi:MAG: leucyl aminopeptidase, partial [Gammaproteobacteria bacterium]
MQFTTKTGRPESVKTDCLVVPVNVARLAGTVANLDAVLGGRIAKVLAGGDLENKPGRVLMVPALEGVEASR